jgi:hypothetical protein
VTDWPDLAPNDLVLYQNDKGRPTRLVLGRDERGFRITIDTLLLDTRDAPPLTKGDLCDIAVKLIRATQ